MGYCNPIPPNAQTILDQKTRERLREMHSRGEKVRTLHDMQRDFPRCPRCGRQFCDSNCL